MSDFAPYTGFGDDLTESVKFAILYDGDRVPNWSGGPRLSERRIPGSGRVNVRSTGRDPYRVSFRVVFDAPEAYAALDAALGTIATLRYPWGITKTVGGHYERILNRAYLTIPGVRLLEMSDEIVDPDGTAEATVTFLKEAP